MSNTCFHCGDPIAKGIEITSTLQNELQCFCCYGCQAIAEHICGADLSLYYERRESQAKKLISDKSESVFTLLEDPDTYQQYVHQGENEHSMQVSLTGITCSACAWLIEKHLQNQPGICNTHVNLSSSLASISWQPGLTTPSRIADELEKIGYSANPYVPGSDVQNRKQERKTAMIRLGVAGVGMMQVMMSAIAMYAGDMQGMDDIHRQLLRWISFIFATPVALYAGLPFYRGALRDLRNKHYTMDLPVSLGILLAFFSSVGALFSKAEHVYFDSVTMFIFFLLLGRFFETMARTYHNASYDQPNLVAVELVTGESVKKIPLNKLKVGDTIYIQPGMIIPVDGILLNTKTLVDESSLTGEYTPVTKKVGDQLLAQTTNIDQLIEISVTHLGQNTKAAEISRITERALSEKPKLAIIADKVAHYFVLAVLITATLTYLFWSILNEPNAYWIMVSVLVVTCPCALSLATPVALTTATNTLKKIGFLITRGHVIESLASVDHVVFDKTGTLTEGKFSVTTVTCHKKEISEEFALNLISGLEQNSNHPIAKAFNPFPNLDVKQIQNISSMGVTGQYLGQIYYFGNESLAKDIGLDVTQFSTDAQEQLSLFLMSETEVLATVSLNDSLRADAQPVIEELKRKGIRVSLLSGDTYNSASTILNQHWFDDFITDCMPDEKWQWIQKQSSKNILMIGDGLNDVPALAGATTSLAMGRSTDLAKLHSDAILLSEQLSTLTTALEITKNAQRIIKQNLFWAALYNATMLPLAVFGLIAPWVAAIGMALSSLFVVLNACRLSKK